MSASPFASLPSERHVHPLTFDEHAEVVAAVLAMIGVLPVGDDERGQARARLASALTKLEKHWCAWCPVEVRNLHAVAHNAAVNYGNGSRERRKMAQLQHTVEHYRPALDEHFRGAGVLGRTGEGE